jgi:hypothetical protein
MTEIIKAEVARQIANDYKAARETKEAEEIAKEILDAAYKGQNAVYLRDVSNQIKESLTSLGYSVETGSQYNEVYTTIRW